MHPSQLVPHNAGNSQALTGARGHDRVTNGKPREVREALK
jgi:hypothetical protein